MNFKKIFPFLILLMVILLPQAFAGQVDNATGLTSEIAIDEPVTLVENDYDEVLTSDANESVEDSIYVSADGDDKNDGSRDAPYATITKAANEAMDTGKTNIYINEGTYRECGIQIETSLNIIGLGNVVIDAEEYDRIFTINGEYDVSLSNLTLINGIGAEYTYYDDHDGWITIKKGGAIDIVSAYVKMDNMTFINNYADDFGGAINVEALYCEIKNSVFISNSAGIFGGAIDFEDNNATVDNCRFIDNEAGNGGAIGYIGSAGTIINSLFENNTAENGAAIFIENGALTFDASNCHLIKNNSFIRNEAIQQGGAIEVENQQMSENADWTLIDANEFIDNYAYNGGAISAYYGDAGITNNIFKNNNAGYGGAIAAISTTDSAWIIIGGIYLKNNTITNCTAEENGNAIYNVGYYGTEINITFIEGKTIYSNDGKAVILNVTVCDDMGNPISGSPIDFTVDGKATINPASDLTEGFGTVRFVPRENGTFVVSGELSKKRFNIDKINLVTGYITVTNAIADYFGTVYVSESIGDDDNTGAEESPVKTFNQAYVLATREGGSFDIIVTEGTYFVPGYTIEKAINITGIGNPVLDGKNQGTLFSIYGKPNDEFHFSGLTFTNGVADPSKYAGMNEGGAIFLKGGILYLENDTFSRNSANDYGGAVHINKGMDSGGTFYRSFAYITNCTFKNNVVKYFGGGISLYDCDVVVSNSSFQYNTAKKGGAISILNGMGNLTVINSTFYKNSASEIGGAIEGDALNTYNIKYFLKVINSTFEENSAENAGAISAGDGNITQCIFVRNMANSYGGAVLTNETFLGEPRVNQSSITYCIFLDNDAPNGADYYGTATLVNDNFWGRNYDSLEELINDNSIGFVKTAKSLSWANIEITGPKEILPGQYEYLVKFMSAEGDLKYILPDYSVKLSNKISNNKISQEDILISSNEAEFIYNATEVGNDTFCIDGEKAYDVNIFAMKNTSLAVENYVFDFDLESKTVSAVLRDENGKSLFNKSIIFIIGDSNYTALTDFEGTASVNVTLTEAKTYNVTAIFEGDDRMKPCIANYTIIVNKINTTVDASNANFLVTKTKTVKITLKDMNGNPLSNKTVTFKINGNTYNRITNSLGQASLKLPALPVKSYKMTVSFDGDEMYVAASKTATIKITKEKTKLTVAKKTYKKTAKSKKLTAVLKSASGKAIAKKKVTFTVNGKKYTGKTNAKGKVTVKVKLTAKKTYKVTVRFSGDSKYYGATKKSSVKIK